MSDLHGLRDGFTDEHLPMFLFLGLVSSLNHVMALLDRCGLSAGDPLQSVDADRTEPGAQIDDPLAALLGLIALHEKIRELKPVRPDAGTADPATAERPLGVSELLR